MNSWRGYTGHFREEARRLRLSVFETTLLVALMIMCLMSAASSLMGRDIGDKDELRMAKLQAQQELVALRMHQSR